MATATETKSRTGMLVALAVGLACLAAINLVVGPRLAVERGSRPAEPPPTVSSSAATVPRPEPEATAVVAPPKPEQGVTAVAAAEPDAVVAAPDAAVAAAPTEHDAAPAPPASAAPGASKSDGPLPAEIRFDTALVWLRPRYTSLLDAVAAAMKKDPRLHLLVRGHADERGGQGYNDRLALKRGQSIVYYLRRKGIAPARISVRSHGARVPAAPGETREAWARNRRVELSWRP